MIKQLLDKLHYDIDKQQNNLEVSFAYIDKEKNPVFTKWKKYFEVADDDTYLNKVNNRTILPCEIVIDIEEPEKFQDILSQIKTEFPFYSAYKTGSKGYHIHLFFDKELTSEEKLKVIEKYGADTQKATNRCMIALEDCPHWKTGNTKTLIEESIGLNDASKIKIEQLEETEEEVETSEEQKLTEDLDLSTREGQIALRERLFDACTTEEGKLDREKLFHLFSKIIIQKFYAKTFSDTDEIYIYNEGIHEVGEKQIYAFIQKVFGHYAKIHTINEIIGHIKRQTYKKRVEFKEVEDMVCLENGILIIKTLEVIPHNPEIVFFNKLPVYYNKDADCPAIKKFISEIVNPEDIVILQEISGYCVYKSYFIHKAIMFVGSGANGKSTFINLIKTFLGQENCVSIPLHHLEEDKFALSNLYGKLANLFADLPARALRNTSIFKMLVGEDLIPAEKKFKDKFFFTNYAKQIFSANQVPRSPDDTDAFFRRWVILNFPNQFLNSKADKKLLSKLTTKEELSGFLNYAIEGLRRLKENEEFSNTISVQSIRENYIRLSDSVSAFILDCVEISPEDYIDKKQLYLNYCDYCRERKYPVSSENTFYKEFPKQVRVEDYRPYIKNNSGERPRCWKGIKILFNKEKSLDKMDKLDEKQSNSSKMSNQKPLLNSISESEKEEEIDFEEVKI